LVSQNDPRGGGTRIEGKQSTKRGRKETEKGKRRIGFIISIVDSKKKKKKYVFFKGKGTSGKRKKAK